MAMDELRGIASVLRTWTGDAAVATDLRGRVRNLGEIRGQLTDPAERAVQIAVNLLRGRRDIDRYFDRGDAAPYLAFLLGEEPQGAASYHDPVTVDDTQALFWLAYLRQHPVVPDRRMVDFVSAMFRVRSRQLWVPAADVFVKMGLSSSEIEREFIDLCNQFAGDRATESNEAPELAVRAEMTRSIHMRRHVRYAAARWLACRGRSEALHERLRDVPEVANPARDATELSIEILCLAARLDSADDRASFLPHVTAFVRLAPESEVVDDAFRHLAEVLSRFPEGGEELCVLERRLLEPPWIEGCGPRAGQNASSEPARHHARISTDAVISWLDSVQVVRRWRPEALDDLRSRYPGVGTALLLRLDPLKLSDPVAALLDRLAVIFDRDAYETTLALPRALCLAEAFELLGHPALLCLPWPSLLRRATANARVWTAHEGTVGEVAMADLIIWLAGPAARAVAQRGTEPVPGEDGDAADDAENARPELPVYLLRRLVCSPEPLPGRAIVCLAALKLGKKDNVSTQVALHAERRLRQEHADPAAEIQFLWKILEVDPPAKFLTELYSVLRGTGTPLHGVVEAIKRMDDARGSERVDSEQIYIADTAEDCEARVQRLAELYDKLATAARVHLATRGDIPIPARAARAAELLTSVAHSFQQLNRTLHRSGNPVDVPLLEALCRVIDGEVPGGGVAAWIAWVEGRVAEERSQLPGLCHVLQAAVQPLLRDPRELTMESGKRAEDAAKDLSSALGVCPWPEREIIECVLTHVRGWLQEQARELAARARFSDQVARWREEPDVGALVRQIGEQISRFDAISIDVLHAVHELLLERGRTDAAERLRERTHGRVRLRTLLEYYIDKRHPQRVVDELSKLSDQDIEGLPALVRQHTHEFLLERLYIPRAYRFRVRSNSSTERSETLRLRPEPLFFEPLLIGILVGAFLMVDFGNNWNSLLEHGNESLFLWTSGFSIVLAYLILVASSLRRTAGDTGDPGLRTRLMVRALGVFAAAIGFSLVCALGLLVTLSGSPAADLPAGVEATHLAFARQVVLWASLSLFLGVVLGVLGQGRGIYERHRPGGEWS